MPSYEIDIEALIRIVQFIAVALLPGLIAEALGHIVAKFMRAKEKRAKMLEYYDDYQAKYKKLVKAGKAPKAAPKEEEASIFQQAKETVIPPEAMANPILKDVAANFAMAKTAFQTSDMVSKVVGVAFMFGGYRLISPMYKGIVFLTLPFEPMTAMGIRNMCHGGIDDAQIRDAGAGFLYSLVSYGARPLVMKILGLEHERFVAPSLGVSEGEAAAAVVEKEADKKAK